jgi:hypothetical protein
MSNKHISILSALSTLKDTKYTVNSNTVLPTQNNETQPLYGATAVPNLT